MKKKTFYEDITGKEPSDDYLKSNNSMFKDITGKNYSNNIIDNRIITYGTDEKNETNQEDQEQNTSGFFKSSKAFDDGYQFGDVTKTLFSSAADLAVNTSKSFLGTVEGALDTANYGLSDLTGIAGENSVSKYFKQQADYNTTGIIFGENDGINLTKKGWTKDLDKNSVLGDTSDAIAQGLGSMGALVGLGALTGGGSMSTFMNSYATSYGNSRSQANRNGVSDKDARIGATISGLSEAISEQIFNGIPGMKTKGWGDKLVGKVGSGVEKYLGSNAGKIATKVMDSLGEGSEEVISNVLQTTGNNIMYLADKNYKVGKENSSLSNGYQFGDITKDNFKSATSQDSINSFIAASLSSALVNGGNTIINNTQKKKILTAYAKDNNITVTEAKSKLNNYVNSQVNTKENVNLPYMEKQNLNENTEYNALQKMKETTNLPTLNKYLNNKTLNNQNYSYKQGDNEKVNEIQKSFTDAGFNNTKETHEFVDRALKISQDLNINIKATNNNQLMNSDFINKAVNLKIEKINNDGNTIIPEQIQQIKKDIVNQIGGFVTTDENGNKTMYLNGNSDQCMNFVLGHELTHVIDDNDVNKEFRKTLYDYAKTTGIYDSERSIVENIYSNGLGNVDDELTANLSGKLMMDESFVKEVYKKPTLFNTLYSKAKELYYKATGKQEKAQYETIIRTFRKVYNNKNSSNIINNNENIQYYMQDDKNKELDNSSFSMSTDEETKKQYGTKLSDLQIKEDKTETNLPMADNIKENVNLPTYDKLKENIIEKKKEKIVKSYNNSIQDEVKRITKGTDKILYFNNSEEKRTFKKIINELYKKDNINYNDVKDIVESNYNTRSLSYNDEYIQNIKKELRNISIQVSDNIKHDISDYKYFRQSNFGKLKLTNDGTPVDVIYSQLSEEYPETFSNEIINPTDQLYRISEVANADSVLVEDYQLDDETLKKASDFIYNAIKNKSDLNELINNISVMPKDIRSGRIKEYRELAKDYITNSATWNDTPLLKQKINTMKRNLRDIMPLKEADNIYNEYFKPIKEHNAEINKETNNYNEKISKLDLNEKESTAVQLLGEAKYNPESPMTEKDALAYIETNKLNTKKIENAVETFRQTYDELFTRVNEALKSQGYKEIPYRKGYFPHFTEEHGKTIIGKMAEKLGWKFTDTSVPTDIAGLTDQFTPGKTWVTFAQERTGRNTDYNVLKGFDNYIHGAMDIIYHTQDIQKLRGLENEIRYQHSDEFLKEKFKDIEDNEYIDSEEKQKKIESLYEGFKNPLNNFVMNLHDYTNNIANKKSTLDRSTENSIGRKWYNTMTNISSRVSANMVGLNVSSALTNFIPITQAYSQVSTKNMLRGIRESVTSSYKNDNISNESVFLTNRIKKADKLYKTGLEKFSDKANLLFESIDEFTSNTIVRGKYYENIDKGMSHKEALENADEFANDVMAGRSKGDNPTVFNAKNPLVKLVTAFQLEVNNQYGYMFKDMPVDLKKEGISKLISAFIKMFMGAWLYNKFSEKLTGRKSAFSPIDTISEIYSTFKNDKLSTYDKLSKSGEKIAEDIPFVGGLLGGGRLPINAALPDFTTTIKDITELNDEEKSKTAWNSLKKELSKPVIYIVSPFGGGQAKKTIEGLSMYDTNLPIAGSYTDSGKLRYEADTSPAGKVQSALFGQYASKNAREYFDNGETPLTSKQIQTIKDTGLSTTEYRKIKEGIKSSKGIKDSDGRYKYEDEDGNIYWYDKNNKTVYDESGNEIEKDINKLNKVSSTEQIYDYVSNLPISNEKKNTLINDELGKTDEIKDQFGYIKYIDEDGKAYWFNDKSNTLYNSKYNEVDSSKKDELTKCSNKVDISNYDNYDSLEEFQYSNNHPEKYQLIKQVGSYKNCKDYIKDIDEIKDNYSDDIDNATTPGKKSIIINKRKREIMQYINSLDLDKSQKIILYKLSGYTVKKYKNTMHNYINNLDIDYESKKSMYNSLFGED